MNAKLAQKTFDDRWRITGVFGIGLVAYVFLITAIFPSIKKMPNIEQFTKSYPRELLKFFGSAKFDFTNFSSYITLEFLGLMMIIIVGAYVFVFARSVTAGEIKDGTLELLVTQPIQRWQIVITKSAVMLGGIVALLVSVILGVFAFGSAFKVGVAFGGFASYLPVAVALFLAIAGYSVLLSVVVPKGGIMASVGITIAFYLLNFIGESVGAVSWVRYLSIFHYYRPADVLGSGSVPWIDVLILAAIGVITLAGAAYLFQHRDLYL